MPEGCHIVEALALALVAFFQWKTRREMRQQNESVREEVRREVGSLRAPAVPSESRDTPAEPHRRP